MMKSRLLFLLPPLFSLLFLSHLAYAVADRSLYLTVDKTVLALGETLTITIQIGNENCKGHAHHLDVYIYDSAGVLVHQVDWNRTLFEQAFGLGVFQPWDFPVKTTYKPVKIDTYLIKLWVIHDAAAPGHRQAYLEDTTIFKVVSYVATTQTTTPSATLVTVTMTLVMTTTSSATVSITTTEMEMVKVDWTTVLILLTAATVAFSVFVAFEIGKKKGKESRELHSLLSPTRGSAKCPYL